MGNRGAALLLVFVISGCTRVVDEPPPQSVPPVAPIAVGQVVDLLSPQVKGEEGNLFVTVEPEDCAGLAREVDPPFISDPIPAATDGGHWIADDAGRDVYIEEMIGVYPSDYNAKNALQKVQHTIESCQEVPFTVTSMQEREYRFELLPQKESRSPNIVLWSYKGDHWACDTAFVAAHNAAIEMSTCSPHNGYNVLALAQDALKRIEKLANTTA